LRWLVVSVAVWALVWLLADLPNGWFVVGAASIAVLAADVVWLSYRVRRDTRRAAER
jgi:hypothetical protein